MVRLKKSETLKKMQKAKVKRGFVHYLLWQLGYYKDSPHAYQLPNQFIYPNEKSPVDESLSSITWVNHSTFIIQHENLYFLTDPIWNQRCSPLKHLGPVRHFLPPIQMKDLPKINFVLISHNHYDHLDHYSVGRLQELFPDIIWMIPEGVKKWFSRHFKEISKDQVIELTWGETYKTTLKNCHIEISSVPAQHFSGRGLFDQNKTLWMGFIVNIMNLEGMQTRKFYYAGDTGYHEEYFKSIGRKYGQVDLSIIPIGVYSPREFMRPVHVNPEESVKIHQEVGSKLSVGCHYGTFKLSNEDLRQPPYDLYLILQKEQLDVKRFRVLDPGQSINW